MKKKLLKQFIKEHEIEYHQAQNDDGEEDVILFVRYSALDDWANVLGSYLLDEGGLPCIMKDGYICYWMNSILDSWGIEMPKFLKKHWLIES